MVIYWLVILIPTVALCIIAVSLFKREQVRLDRQQSDTAMERARSVADTLNITVSDIEARLTDELKNIKTSEARSVLYEWKQNNPLIRNVFIWDKAKGFTVPSPNSADTEDKRFIARYEPMFDGGFRFRSSEENQMIASAAKSVVPQLKGDVNVPVGRDAVSSGYIFKGTKKSAKEEEPLASKQMVAMSKSAKTEKKMIEKAADKVDVTFAKPSESQVGQEEVSMELADAEVQEQAYQTPQPSASSISSSYEDRKQEAKKPAAVYDWTRSPSKSKAENTKAAVSSGKSSGKQKVESGWTPWFSGNQVYLIGWINDLNKGTVYGVEVETMTLLSQLISAFPERLPAGVIMGLVDGTGNVVHQVGGDIKKTSKKQRQTVSLEPFLPHWQVAIYMDGNAGLTPGYGFLGLGSIILLIFVLAIVSASFMMMREARRNAVEAMQKTSFVSNVSHELKTPLTSIRMYAEMLGEEKIHDEHKKRRYIDVIISESRRLTRLVNNVLDFSRLEQGRKKYAIEEIPVSEYIAQFIESHMPRFKDAGIKIDVSQLCPVEMMMKVDRDSIEQVFINILDNAVKYASQGGEIKIKAEPLNGKCRISFMDRGSGIPESQRDKIFDKFYRIDNSLTSTQSGCGLGLSITKGLLTGMGGSIRYEPRDGGGSMFIVDLPIA